MVSSCNFVVEGFAGIRVPYWQKLGDKVSFATKSPEFVTAVTFRFYETANPDLGLFHLNAISIIGVKASELNGKPDLENTAKLEMSYIPVPATEASVN